MRKQFIILFISAFLFISLVPFSFAKEKKNFFSLEIGAGKSTEAGVPSSLKRRIDTLYADPSVSVLSIEEQKTGMARFGLIYERALKARHHLGFRLGFELWGWGQLHSIYTIENMSSRFVVDEKIQIYGLGPSYSLYYRYFPKRRKGLSPYSGVGFNTMDAIIEFHYKFDRPVVPTGSPFPPRIRYESRNNFIPFLNVGLDYYWKYISLGVDTRAIFLGEVRNFKSLPGDSAIFGGQSV